MATTPLLLLALVSPKLGAAADNMIRLSANCDGPLLTLCWDSMPGKQYRFYATTNLTGGWQEVDTQPNPLLGTGDRLSYTFDSNDRSQFYYLAELTPPAPRLVWIPSGTFVMGSPINEPFRGNDEAPQTTVTISQGFWIGEFEVTQGEYLTVMGSNPSFFNGIHSDYPQPGTNTDYGLDTTRPVEQVNWFDATNYCGMLTAQERALGRISTSLAYRLPTEAEWEYACRAGTTTLVSYGDDPGLTNLFNYAWYVTDSALRTHSVGQKLPNPWGLYDMYGNVSEWCQDWQGEYAGGSITDPQGPVTGLYRMIRGGSYGNVAGDCRSADRNGDDSPSSRFSSVGIRVVLAPAQP